MMDTLPPLFGLVTAGAFGAVVGSFLNVVIHRLPGMMERSPIIASTASTRAAGFGRNCRRSGSSAASSMR